MSQGSYMLAYTPAPVSLDDLERELSGSFEIVERQHEGIVVRMDNGPELFLGPSDEPHVIREAQEVAEDHALPEIGVCRQRIEVVIDDLEAALDDINTLFEAEQILTTALGGYILRAWNGTVVLPDGMGCDCKRCGGSRKRDRLPGTRLYFETLTPYSMLRRRDVCRQASDPFAISLPPGWIAESPGVYLGDPDHPRKPPFHYSLRPRPMGPLPSPDIHLHLLVAESSPHLDDDALGPLVQEPVELYLAFDNQPRYWEALRAVLGMPVRKDREAPGPFQTFGLAKLGDERARRRALDVLARPEEEAGRFALVAAPRPAFFDLVGSPPDPECPLSALLRRRRRRRNDLPYTDLHRMVSSCQWVLLENEAGLVFLYSTEDLRDRFPDASPVLMDALPGARRKWDSPPLDAAVRETLETARQIDLSEQDAGDLWTLREAVALEELIVDSVNALDLETLSTLHGLRSLSMFNVWVEDLSFLEDLPNLERLSINVTPAQGWSELLRLKRLRYVDVGYYTRIPDEVLVNLVGVAGPNLRRYRLELAARRPRDELDRLLILDPNKLDWNSLDARTLCVYATAVEAPSLAPHALDQLRSRARTSPGVRGMFKRTLRTILRRSLGDATLRASALAFLYELDRRRALDYLIACGAALETRLLARMVDVLSEDIHFPGLSPRDRTAARLLARGLARSAAARALTRDGGRRFLELIPHDWPSRRRISELRG